VAQRCDDSLRLAPAPYDPAGDVPALASDEPDTDQIACPAWPQKVPGAGESAVVRGRQQHAWLTALAKRISAGMTHRDKSTTHLISRPSGAVPYWRIEPTRVMGRCQVE
jgi:hypothetical protein